jgi:hypothetical protein
MKFDQFGRASLESTVKKDVYQIYCELAAEQLLPNALGGV